MIEIVLACSFLVVFVSLVVYTNRTKKTKWVIEMNEGWRYSSRIYRGTSDQANEYAKSLAKRLGTDKYSVTRWKDIPWTGTTEEL